MQTRQPAIFLVAVITLCLTAIAAFATSIGISGSAVVTTARSSVQLHLYAATITDDEEEGGIDLTSPEVVKKIRIINLGPVVNTKVLDYAPTVTADGKTLYFVSNRPGSTLNADGDPSHDFWAAKKLENLDTNFFPPFNIDTIHTYGLEQSVNTIYNEGVASIAADRQTLVFTGCNRPDGFGDCDIYIVDIEGDRWGKPRNLGRQVNSEFWDSQPSITSDKSRIYFASNRPGPNGDRNIDIWYTDFDEETNQWKAAQNLTAINTSGTDWSPFIAPDNITLFFASDGHKPNIGDLDFYFVKKSGVGADGKDTWSKPVHLPPPLNTPGKESFLSMPASGDVMYFASTRADLPGYQGSYDLFMAFVPTFFRAVQVRVQVLDECSGENIPATITIRNPITGRIVRDSVTFTEKITDFVFGNEAFGASKDPNIAIDLEIEALNPQYGSKKVTQRITKPKITRDRNAASKPDEYDVVIRMGQRPVLDVDIAQSQYAKQNPNDPEMQGFRGLVMRQIATITLYPLLNYVFFDVGSSQIPKRYVLFNSPEKTTNFTDERIPGGTLEKYYHILNIFGYRLRKNPSATVEIVGTTDDVNPEEKQGGLKLAETRARNVYNYLRDIWGISENRMKLTFLTRPKRPSNMKDSMGIEENRRVEILCEDWEVIKPILDKDPKVVPQPETMAFVLKNGIEDKLVAKRRIEVTRSDKPWKTIVTKGTTEPTVEWDWQNQDGEYPDSTSRVGKPGPKVSTLVPFSAKLIVTSTSGRECESDPITIPVKYVSTASLGAEYGEEKTLEKYNLILFPFDSYDAGPRNERILSEYVLPRCFTSSEVEVVGHTDVVGMYEHNKKLSANRAATVERAVKTRTKGVKELISRGVGEDDPIYDNNLPEGRFYNRTVQIVIQTPLKDAQLDLTR
ncbi:MAG: OmpA family protein [Chlorobi bacterium]|nr:OmpA family protein [Chlorobiota bacterium]